MAIYIESSTPFETITEHNPLHHPPMLFGKKLRLRAIEFEDLPKLVAWRNHAEVRKYFFEYEPLSLRMQQRWYEAFLNRTDEKYWIAEGIDTAEPIGTIGLLHIDFRNRHAELARVLVADPQTRRGGVGREMCTLALQYAFKHLNLRKVYLEVFADNAAAIGLYQSLGFVIEGQRRNHVYSNGRFEDVLIMALFSADDPSQTQLPS